MKKRASSYSRLMRRDSGVILLMVLGLLMVLSILVTHFLKEVITEVRYRSQVFGDPQLKRYAYDGLEISLAVLNEINTVYGGLFSPEQGWKDPLAYANIQFPKDVQVRIKICDETGKIPLQNIDKRCFDAFCESIGIGSSEASSLSQPLIAWVKRKKTPATLEKPKQISTNLKSTEMSSNKEGEVKHPSQTYLFSTYLKSYSDLQNFPHFREIFWGNTINASKLLERFVDGTSLYHRSPININTANNDVLEALGKTHSLNVDDIKKFLKGDSLSSQKPRYYRSLEKLNELGHGHLKLTKPSPLPLNPDKDKKKDEEKKPKDDKAQNTAMASLGIDVKCQVLRIQVETQRGDVCFTLTAVVKVDSTFVKSATQSSRSDKDLTPRKGARYANNVHGMCGIKLIGLTENGQIDW